MGSYVHNNLIAGEQVVFETHLHWVIFISLSGLLTLFLRPLFQRWTSEFAVTNKRIVIKTGWIARETLEMNLQKVESVQLEQSVMGRLLGYGDLTVIGTGGTHEPFRRIAGAAGFRRAFQEMIAAG